MLLPPPDDHDGADVPESSVRLERSGVTAEKRYMPPATPPNPTIGAGHDVLAGKTVDQSPHARLSAASSEVRGPMRAQTVTAVGNVQGHISAVRHHKPATTSTLRSITTPAEQLRLKDEQITMLTAQVHALEKEVHEHQAEIAAQVTAAAEAERSATFTELEHLKVAVAQAKQDLQLAKDTTARREAALQVRTASHPHAQAGEFMLSLSLPDRRACL